MTVDIDQTRALIDLCVEKDVAELEVETETVRVRIVRTKFAPATAFAPAPMIAQAPANANAAMSSSGAAAAPDADSLDITSPFVGTFYRAPTPDAPNFVEVGSVVRPGQTLCIIEAMKLMNEIEAECSGTITEVFAQNGKPVEFGQPLFRVKKA